MSRIDDSGRRVSSQPSKPATPAEKPAEKQNTATSTPASNPVKNSQTVRQYAGESSFETQPQRYSAKAFTAEGAQSPTTASAVQATTAASGPQPLNPQSVAAANSDYDKYKNMGAATTAVFVQLMQDHKGDSDYVAQLVNRAKESSPGVLDYMMGPLNGAFQKDSGGAYAGFSDADRQTIVDSLNTARAKGTLTDQEIRDHAARSPGWQDVAQRLGVSQAGHDSSTDAATAEVSKAQQAYNDADKDVKEKEERLAKELADFGPALTNDQRAAYIKAFREDPKNKEAYAKQAQAAEALGQVLSKNRATLERAAISDPQARQQLYDSLKAVASSATPKAALEIYGDIAANPNAPLGQAFSQYTDISKDVLQPALGGTAGQLLAENGGDTQKAFAELQKLIAPIKDAYETYGSPLSDAKGGVKDVQEAWEAVSEAAKGNLNPLNKLAEDWNKVGEAKGAMAKGLASAGLVLGAAGVVSDARSGFDDLQKGEYASAIENFAKAGQDGLEIVAGGTKALADTGKLAEYTGKALKFADFAAKLAPGLGLIANSAAFVDHLGQAAKDKNAGFAIAAVGDALGVLGSAVELIPGGEPAGALVGGIGTIISAGGELFGNFLEKKGFEDEQKRFLEAANVPADLRKQLFEANGDRVRELANDLHLSPEQIQDLTRTYPNLLEGTGRGVVLDNFKKMVSSLGLNHDQVYDLMKSIGQNTGNNPAALEVFFNRLSRDLYPQNGQEWLNAIHDIATDPRNADSLHQVFGNVDRYLQSQIQGPPAPPRS